MIRFLIRRLLWTLVVLLGMSLIVFVIKPVLAKGGSFEAYALGAFFGLICYATYDLSNLATLKDWPVVVTVVCAETVVASSGVEPGL